YGGIGRRNTIKFVVGWVFRSKRWKKRAWGAGRIKGGVAAVTIPNWERVSRRLRPPKRARALPQDPRRMRMKRRRFARSQRIPRPAQSRRLLMRRWTYARRESRPSHTR